MTWKIFFRAVEIEPGRAEAQAELGLCPACLGAAGAGAFLCKNKKSMESIAPCSLSIYLIYLPFSRLLSWPRHWSSTSWSLSWSR